MTSLSRRCICHLPLLVYFGKIFFDLMFEKELFADFQSNGRIFHIFGPR